MSVVDADLVGAAALALAALAIFFSLWAPALTDALSVDRKDHLADREREIEIIGNALRKQALPLSVASTSVGVVLAPPVLNIIGSSLARFMEIGFSSFFGYQADQALFLLVWIMIGALSWMSVDMSRRLYSRKADFERP